jgi:hypothetical protein
MPISLHGPNGDVFAEFNMLSKLFKNEEVSVQALTHTSITQNSLKEHSKDISKDREKEIVYIKVPVAVEEAAANIAATSTNPRLSITTSRAEASGDVPVKTSGMSLFEILLILFLTTATLLYTGYKYHLKNKTPPPVE